MACKQLYAKHGDLFEKPTKKVRKPKVHADNSIDNLLKLHGHD